MPDDLRSQQQAWARYIRDPRQPPPAGIDPERMALYRALCTGSVVGVLSGSYSRLRNTLGSERWQQLVAQFYGSHRCATPLYPELGGEFLAWIMEESCDDVLPAPLIELAHFEWTAQQLLLAADVVPVIGPPLTLATPLRLSPLVRICGYSWPVEQAPAALPAAPPLEPTLLLLQRTRAHALRITQLPALDYALLQAIDQQPLGAEQHLQAIAHAYGEPVAAIIEYGRHLLPRLQADGVVQAANATTGTLRWETGDGGFLS
jgi:hypothetical protein